MKNTVSFSSAEASRWAQYRADQEALAAQARADFWMTAGIVAVCVLVILFTALMVRKDVARALKESAPPKPTGKGRRSLSFTKRDRP